MKKKIVIAVTGSSGAIYARILFEKLKSLRDQWQAAGIVMSDNARLNWEMEIGPFNREAYPEFDFYEKNDFFAPFASGSARYDTVILCPCSMGALARVASGVSTDLVTRAADVALKERRKLILVTRETPLSLLHLRNMVAVTEAGGIVLPACPSFYSKPASLDAAVSTVTDRILDLAGFELAAYRWGEEL